MIPLGILAAAQGRVAPVPVYLDELPVQPRAAWSLKKLISTASVALRVRRDSDNAELDIGFTDDELDVSALLSFVGGGNGYIPAWYDQTAGAKHLTQATAGQQPKIVNAGSYLGEIAFDGVNDLAKSSAVTMGTAFLGVYMNVKRPNDTTSKVMVDTTEGATVGQGATMYVGGSNRWYLMGRDDPIVISQLSYNPANETARIPVVALYNRGAATLPDQLSFWHNDVEQTATGSFGGAMTGLFASNPVAVGAGGDGATPGDTAFETIALYNVDTAAYRAAIQAMVAAS